jgi:putative ABC transport system permease protein
MGTELRHAARRLTRSPAFTLAALATLALAIGANASIFAVLQGVVLNPLPYPYSDRLVEVDHGSVRLNLPAGLGLTAGIYHQYTERARSFDAIAMYRNTGLTLTGGGEPERLGVTRTTTTLMSVQGVAPALGRWFTADEGRPAGDDAPANAVISDGLWQRRYQRDPHVIGQVARLGGVPTTIVGVMPPGFAFPDSRIDVWVAERVSRETGFGLWGYRGVARLRAGATPDGARAELAGLIADMPAAFPGDALARGNLDIGILTSTKTLKQAIVGEVASSLWILSAAVGLVLIVGCANVANLFLVRNESRQRDVAVRRALGASAGEIARYFVAESVWLSIGGGIAGLAIAWTAVRLLVRLGPSTLPRLNEVTVDLGVAAFTFGLSVVTAIVFGAIPLARRSPVAAALHAGGRSQTASRAGHRVRQALMGAQVALALVLLVASGLMIRSFQNLRAIDPGFDPASALTFSIGLPDADYPSVAAAVAAHHAILERLTAIPGVVRASAASCLPLAVGCFGNTAKARGREYPAGTLPPPALFNAVAGGYFEAMGTRILRGRGIDRSDVDRREPVVVVDQIFADRHFRGEDALGREIAFNRPGELTWLRIVGIAATTPTRALGEASPLPKIYMPMSIAGGPGIPERALRGPNVASMTYIVRSAAGTDRLLPAVRQAIDGIDRNLAIAQPRTLQETLDRASAQMAFTMVLLAIAAAITLVLGIVGIYGVTSYIVTQRTAEIGVRLALGAAPAAVAAMIARQGGTAAAAGVGLGLAAALASGRAIRPLLYRVSPRDPVVMAAAAVALFAVALVSAWLPARRAARLNPLDALRAE